MGKEKVNIILVDWNGYPLRRKKKLSENVLQCGLRRLLDRLNKTEAGIDFGVILVINCNDVEEKTNIFSSWLRRFTKTSNETYLSLQKNYSFIQEIHFRNNIGMDLGAYNYGLKILQNKKYEGDVIFMNSSVIGPKRDNWLIDYKNLFNNTPNTGLCGITLNSHNTTTSPRVFMPHVQSFFIYSNTRVFSKVFDGKVPGFNISSDKNKLINEGEIKISQRVLEAGYSIRCSAFPEFNYIRGNNWTIPEGDLRFMKKYYRMANRI